MNPEATKRKITIVDYSDVNSSTSNIEAEIHASFGADINSPGLIGIRNIPGFTDSKKKLLSYAHKLAHLPNDYLESHLTDEKSLYNAGWSRGKEKLGDDVDYAKGSFYFNPLNDTPGTQEERDKYPLSFPCNVWPEEGILPGFEDAAKHLGRLMFDVVVQLARHLDVYAAKRVEGYGLGTLHDAMAGSEKAKGRLLYYYPAKDEKEDSWIGWHNDSGFLTALAGDLYVNDQSGMPLQESPDPHSGLYVADANGISTNIQIPEDVLAVQLGECVQIITAGEMVATPHCVRAASASMPVSRVSFPLFVDTLPSFPLEVKGCNVEKVLSAGIQDRVPPLCKRWKNGVTFGEFLKNSFEEYYNFTQSQSD